MKKIILVLIMLPLLFNVANSEEKQPELEEAPKALLLSLLENCKQDAIEDEVMKKDLNKYLLTCINDELEAINYKLIKVLPKDV
ncbi:hypothetical protein AADZ91_00815 [Colwelliaceae bacterium 6441]